jgi:Dyp-type peroxidase family
VSDPPVVDKADLQGNVLTGYGTRTALYLFLRITHPPVARELLGGLLGRVTSAVSWGEDKANAPSSTLNLALTFDGLRQLGVPHEVLASFPEEFRLGMAARAQLLGDVGASAPGAWEAGIRPGEPHVLVTITSDDEDTIAAERESIGRDVDSPDAGMAVVHEQAARLIERSDDSRRRAREHFGFADGLAQPTIAGPQGPAKRPGGGAPTEGGWAPIAPGEFVLGYPDEDGLVAEAPAAPLRHSGSFMVVRKLYQDVALFNRFLKAAAGPDPKRQARLAAKIVGRWADGTPLVISPDRPRPELDPKGREFNDYRYLPIDAAGFRCPLGAHVRRANPRDSLGWHGDLTRRHRIIRRGMPYGEPPVDRMLDDGVDRGLMFVCYQASIARQFEVIQGSWLTDGDAFGLGPDRDLLIAGDEGAGRMVIQGDPPEVLSAEPRFVHTRGGAYFFVPGISALRALADADWYARG